MKLRCFSCEIVKVETDFPIARVNRTGRRNTCRSCYKIKNAAYYRSEKYRAAHNMAVEKWMKANPHKFKAKSMVKIALDKGEIVRRPCERCGDPLAQAHHEDYSKPLEVVWLCVKHHRERHRELKMSA